MKSHFQFTIKQRNGIFLLIAIVLIFQSLYWFFPFNLGVSNEDIPINQEQIAAFKAEIDSLRIVEIEKNTPKIFPFNPNYITDHKGYSLGMSNEEIDRLHKFREGQQWINSAQQFQEVTKVSDSFLATISPYFKFPDWVSNSKSPNKNSSNSFLNSNKAKTWAQKSDLNTATAEQLKKINGIGEKLSERIINYRNKHQGGFIDDIQLGDIYGLSPEVIERIQNEFTVKTPRIIQKLSLNTATRDQLVSIQYIDYDVAHKIIEERTLRDGFKSLEELTKVEGFPLQKLEIIKLYLHL